MQARPPVQIRAYRPEDQAEVVALWQACGLTRPWNDPVKDIARKMTVQPELFLVAVLETAEKQARVVGTAMVGYEGHRGWVNYLAVAPDQRRLSLGRTLMQEAETRLLALGCPKLNLLVRSSNTEVLAFYRQLGYGVDEAVSLGKRLIPDLPPGA